MISSTYDVIVVGLGAMGSAAAYELARRGRAVLGLDCLRPPHTHGSSHGESRIIREAYFEDPVYVPMVQRAYALWAQLEQQSGAALYLKTGGVMIGAPESDLVVGTLRSAREHGLAHELIDARQIRARFPALHPSSEMVGVVEPRAGILLPERCVAAQLELASAAGANLHFDEPVLRWKADESAVRVYTDTGAYSATELVVTAGAWTSGLFPDLQLPFNVERQTLYWFDAQGSADIFSPKHCPIHLWQFDGRHFFYGLPDLGEGIKVARHHDGATTTPDTVERAVSPEEIDDVQGLVRRFVPRANGALRKSAVCLYTNTPDEHFWIDAHPAHPNVMIVSPCSGHGFKFAPVIGEVVADLVTDSGHRFDLSLFKSRESLVSPVHDAGTTGEVALVQRAHASR